MRTFLCTALMAVVPTVSTTLRAQQRPSQVFPPSAFMVVEFSGLAQLQEYAQSQGVAELVKGVVGRMEPEARRQLLGQAVGEIALWLSEVELSPRDLRALLDRPMALMVGRFDFFDGVPMPSVGLAFAAEEPAQLLRSVEEQLIRGGRLTATEANVEGTAVRRIQHPFASGSVMMGTIGGMGLVTNSRGLFADCLRARTGAATAAKEGDLVRAHVNTAVFQPMIEFMRSMLPYGFEDMPERLGIERLDGIRIGTAVDGAGCVDYLHVNVGGNPEGLLKVLMAQPATFDAARYCSEDTVLFGSMAPDVAGLLAGLEGMVESMPEQVRAEMRRDMAREWGIGLDQLQQLVATLGQNVAFAVEMFPNQFVPALTVFVDVKDENAIRRKLERMEAQTGTEWKVIEPRQDGEVAIRYTAVTMDGFTLRPSYAFREGQLIVGSDVTKLRQTLRRPLGDEATLEAVPSFRDAMQRYSGAGLVVHSRMHRTAELVWPAAAGVLRGFLASDDAKEMGLSDAMVPEVEELAKALGDATFALTVDQNGMRLEQRSNLGLGSMLCLIGLGLGETLDALTPSNR